MDMSPEHRPRVYLSTAMSADGFIDDTSGRRLILSSAEDLDAVDALRASCDAILVGAGAIRSDNPRLVIRSAQRRQDRLARGLSPDPIKVTITRQGNLDAQAGFFQAGDAPKLVYCPHDAAGALRSLEDVATVVATGEEVVSPASVLADLFARGVRTLLIEGGTAVNTLFLSAGLVDELRLAVAPFFVGEDGAPRFVSAGRFPHNNEHRMTLTKVERLGDVAVLWYLLCAGAPSS
jgi:5-amino-6-(5-phosphoribosylamino)uracil reductase